MIPAGGAGAQTIQSLPLIGATGIGGRSKTQSNHAMHLTHCEAQLDKLRNTSYQFQSNSMVYAIALEASSHKYSIEYVNSKLVKDKDARKRLSEAKTGLAFMLILVSEDARLHTSTAVAVDDEAFAEWNRRRLHYVNQLSRLVLEKAEFRSTAKSSNISMNNLGNTVAKMLKMQGNRCP